MNIGTEDVTLGVTAAGTTQATATLLITNINQVTTVAAGSGVLLFSGLAGGTQMVYNGGANALKVYPPLAAQINGLAVNAAITLATNTSVRFFFLSATQIAAILSA